MEEELSFEDTIKELEQIAQELESGNLNLDDSVTKFEKGMELSKKCSKVLNNAEKRINILIEKEDGLQEESFTVEE